jgi:tRNA A-37 threonylcarbamoyl transferase component Bud32
VSSSRATFSGTERFQILGELGHGGAGTVYLAFDRLRRVRLAVKTLTNLDPELGYRFKREFRALSNVRHENVAELFELVADAEPWFFTMELIDGCDFMSHLRGSAPAPNAYPESMARTAQGLANYPANDTVAAPARDMERLRRAFGQLCKGLDALHANGLLHRDIKPSNVLVNRDGLVVLVDFGIVAEIHDIVGRSGDLSAMVGTPAYMAPEQCSGQPVSAATDWYAVGVMLFEALVGRLPFEGRGTRILEAKLEKKAPRASSRVDGIPADLDALCARLLATNPADRPGSLEIMRVFDAALELDVSRADDALFVGREEELSRLQAAFLTVRPGQPAKVHLAGTSGMGKSTLLERFLHDVATRDGAIVLRGRCCEREAVPFKALDDLIDVLALYLESLPEEKVPALNAESAAALTRLFPVLGRVPSWAEGASEADAKTSDSVNSLRLRARALDALRSLLRALASERRVVLAIDDAQWGDEDSAALLRELLGPPDPPGVLLVLAYRKEWEGKSPLLVRGPGARADQEPVAVVKVDPLGEERARALAAHWLRRADDDPAVSTIVAEAGGSPFVLMEFAHHVRAAGMPEGGLDLSRVLATRFAELPDAPRRMLDALSVAARPVAPLLAASAAGLAPEEGMAALRTLHHKRLVRDSDARAGERCIETFHDRVRETAVATLTKEQLSAQHGRLAEALCELAPAETEVIYLHFREAGQNARASDHAARAAEQASKSLAFNRAAELFAAAIELAPQGESRLPAWHAARADALAYAGRKKDAGDAYVLASGLSKAAGPWLTCAAIQQYISGGYFDIGKAIADRALRDAGLPLAPTRARTLLAIVGRMTWLRMRGTGFVERREADVPKVQLDRVDAAYRIGRAMSITDPLHGGDMFLRAAMLALETGEPTRISQTLGCVATMILADGPSTWAERVQRQSVELAERTGDTEALAVMWMMLGCSDALIGKWRNAHAGIERADALLQRLGIATTELYDTRSVGLYVRFYLGRIRELTAEVPLVMADAIEREDVYIRGMVSITKAGLCWLAMNEPDKHRELVVAGVSTKPKDGYLLIEHVASTNSLVDNDLYVGKPEQALARLAQMMPAAHKSLMLRLLVNAIQTYDGLGRAALMAACHGRDAKKQRRLALKQAATLEKTPLPWPRSIAALLRAGEADAAGRAEDAVLLYRQAVEAFEAAHMALHATVARLRLGQWLGGDEGAALAQLARAWLVEQGVVDPTRLAMMLAPTTRE